MRPHHDWPCCPERAGSRAQPSPIGSRGDFHLHTMLGRATDLPKGPLKGFCQPPSHKASLQWLDGGIFNPKAQGNGGHVALRLGWRPDGDAAAPAPKGRARGRIRPAAPGHHGARTRLRLPRDPAPVGWGSGSSPMGSALPWAASGTVPGQMVLIVCQQLPRCRIRPRRSPSPFC